MRRIVPLAVAALALAGAVSEANAAITVSVAPAPNFLTNNTTNINSTLAANGWAAYLVTLTSDAAAVTTVELKNDLQLQGGTIGISGPMHQDSKISSDDGTTRISTASAAGGVANGSTQQGRDSVFLNSGYYNVGVPSPFTEDNNKVNSANPPYVGSPLSDTPANLSASPPTQGNDFGVGSLMTFTGAGALANASTTLQLAYIIAPTDAGTNPADLVTIRGYAIDGTGAVSFFSVPINGGVIVNTPEPASLGVLALGGLSLLARRRRSA